MKAKTYADAIAVLRAARTRLLASGEFHDRVKAESMSRAIAELVEKLKELKK